VCGGFSEFGMEKKSSEKPIVKWHNCRARRGGPRGHTLAQGERLSVGHSGRPLGALLARQLGHSSLSGRLARASGHSSPVVDEQAPSERECRRHKGDSHLHEPELDRGCQAWGAGKLDDEDHRLLADRPKLASRFSPTLRSGHNHQRTKVAARKASGPKWTSQKGH